MQHLDDNLAAEFVSGALPPPALVKVEKHLASCRECRTLVAALAADSAQDSSAATVPLEKLSPSQVAERPVRSLTVGDRVGRYLILTTLGTGGMGVVFSAYDPQLDRKVALKLLRAGLNYSTKDARTRLRREAQAIAQLSHPNVVGVYDVGETDEGDLYIAMEFVEGETLTAWLKAYPRSWREIIEVFLQAGRGVVAAHDQHLLHRDFKPDNVLVGGGDQLRIRVTDFGLARSAIASEDIVRPPELSPGSSLNADLTATGTVLGTPRYMAPEQLVGPDIDARADQFSFCVALYEALFGQHPLPGATSVSMLEKHDKPFAPPESKVPPTIARAIMRGLERDPVKRFPNMRALINELAPAPARSSARYVVLGLASVVVVGGSVAAASWPHRAPGDEPTIEAETNTQVLVERLNASETERRALFQKVVALTQQLERKSIAESEVKVLREQLSLANEQLRQKDAEIQSLLTSPRQTRKVPAARSVQITFAVSQADRDLEGCFTEWNERVHGDADMVVRLVVDHAGVASDAVSTRGPDSTALRLCVAEAIGRVKYPPGPDVFDLEVNVQWSEGLLNTAARIIGKRMTLHDL